MPSAGHSSSATAFTVSNRAASSPGAPAAAIQLADSLTPVQSVDRRRREVGQRLGHRHAARRRPVDQRQRRALADRERLARDAVVVDSSVTAQSATGTCHGPTIWSRAHRPPTVRSPIVMRKRLVGDRRVAQHAARRPRRATRRVRSTGGNPRLTALHVACHARRLAEQHLQVACRPARLSNSGSTTSQLLVVGGLADAPRTGSARARRAP